MKFSEPKHLFVLCDEWGTYFIDINGEMVQYIHENDGVCPSGIDQVFEHVGVKIHYLTKLTNKITKKGEYAGDDDVEENPEDFVSSHATEIKAAIASCMKPKAEKKKATKRSR